MLIKNQIRLILIALCMCSAAITQGQSKGSIDGIIVDEDHITLPSATVVLITAEDSVLTSFGISDKEGKFSLRSIPFGEYILQVSFIGQKSTSIPFSLSSSEAHHSFGEVVLSSDTYEIGAASVEESIPIIIKKDTIEYNASSFKTQEGDNVEKLLQKLPGVKVDKDGSIKAQGEDVQKVLVDGKEFFGDDPKMATQNLPADAIDKVQVFDKKSDFAEFSGLDDGSREKTINLTLKDGKKGGVFGDIEGGYGTDGFFDNRLSINRFDKNAQMSVLGQANNVNKQGFSFQDYFQFAGGFDNMMMGGGLEISEDDLPIPLDFGDNKGLTKTYAGGGNYNRTFSTRTDLQSSFFYNQMQKSVENDLSRRYVGISDGYNSNSSSNSGSTNQNFRANLRLNHKPDSSARILVTGQARRNNFSNFSFSDSQNLSLDGTQLSGANTENASDRLSWNGSGTASYSKKLKKLGRIMSLQGGIQIRDNDNDATVESLNELLLGDTTFISPLHQRQDRIENMFQWDASLSFTEPISLNSYLQFEATYSEQNSQLEKRFFDVATGDQPEVLNESLSSQFNNLVSSSTGGVEYNIRGEDFHLAFGGDYQQTLLEGIVADSLNVNQKFEAFRPSAYFNYQFTTTNQIRAFLSTNMRIPTLQELQPLVDNSDPLNIYIGNPDLNAETRYSLNLGYLFYSQFSFTGFNVRGGVNYTRDKIVSSVLVDESLVQTISPINSDYQLGINASASFDAPIRPLKMLIGIEPEADWSEGFVFVNGLSDKTQRLSAGGEISLENRFKEKLDWAIGTYLRWNQTQYERESSFNQEYLLIEYFADLDLDLGKRWDLGASATLELYSGQLLNSSQILLLESYVSRSFLKSERLTIKIRAYDILNQRQGIFRTSSLNYIEEEFTNTLSRYVMFSATWRLSKFKSKGLIHIDEGR